ncbi:ribosome biogenesis GTP-binding protein YsxC [Candidatus Uhrbacteria bacterium]|nr:ribosome biogenesis GTP-binding protein YsxC [Candidatus Uhrbacteria bacterium]
MLAIFLKSAFRPADLPKSNKPQIAMLGRSNVGKSSLINHLAGAKNLARTSAQPGLTQAINLYEFDGRYLLVDLPGYGYSRAKRSKGKGFAGMLSDYLSEAKRLKLVLLIIDGRHGLMENDRYALDQLLRQEIRFVVVFNKVDKLSNSAAAQGLRQVQAEFPDINFIPHSTADGKGLGEIRDAIERAVRAE